VTPLIAPNVKRGAELLDEKFGGPEWDEKIDLRKLDLGSTCNCVVGQLAAGRGVRKHSRYTVGLDRLAIRYPHRYGFTVAGRQRFDRLTTSWKALIRQRRKERAAA
jgi:hypothetical protein